MTPDSISRLEHWISGPSFRALTVDQAAAKLALEAPHYPHPADQPIEICANGHRWFGTEAEALADAIFRSRRLLHGPGETMAAAEWGSAINHTGLWAIPGQGRAAALGRRAVHGPSDRVECAAP